MQTLHFYVALLFVFIPVSLEDKGRSVLTWERSCSRLAERRLGCPGWGQCNTFLRTRDKERLVRILTTTIITKKIV